MKKLNPVERSNYINKRYKEYLSSTFKFDNDKTQSIFEKKLENENLFKGPYVDLILPFKKGKNINELIDEGIMSPLFKKLENIDYNRPLYLHQEKAIRNINFGRGAIITTGTGSGKTECFLYPILNDILKSIEEGNNEIGIRAIFLYPMNALVNDQIDRFRSILSKYPKISYGFYTGDTDEKETNTLREKLKEINGVEIPQNELVSRESIRENPPHLLFTNYSMLEYLLIRPKDSAIFQKERLKNWKFVVLDEAHTYNGALGIELSMLMRRLTSLANIKPNFILTSATLGEKGKSEKDIVEFAKKLTSTNFEEKDIIFSERIDLKKQKVLYSISGTDYILLKENIDDSNTIRKIVGKYIDVNTENNKEIIYELLIHDKNIYEIYNILKENCLEFNELYKLMGSCLEVDELISLIDLINFADKNGEGIYDLKYHSFVRPLSGAYITLTDDTQLTLTKTNYINGYKAFELGNCRYCNTPYIFGKIKDKDGLNYLYQNNEIDIYENYGENKNYIIDYFLLNKEDEDNGTDLSQLEEYEICIKCGELHSTNNLNALKCDCKKTKRVKIYKVNNSNSKGISIYNNINSCPCCGHKSHSGIVRNFNLGKDEGTAIIAQLLFEAIDEEDNSYENKKGKLSLSLSNNKVKKNKKKVKQFLTFSDSRQQASFAATFFDSNHDRMLRKRLIWEIIKKNNYRDISINEVASLLTEEIKKNELFNNSMTSHKNAWITLLTDLLKVDGSYDGEGMGLYYFDIDLSDIDNGISEEDVEYELGNYHINKQELLTIIQIILTVFKTSSAVNYSKSTLTPEEKKEYLDYRRFDNAIMYSCPSTISGIKSFTPIKKTTNFATRYIEKVCNCNKDEAIELMNIIFNNLLLSVSEQLGENERLLISTSRQGAYQFNVSRYILKNYKSSNYYQCKKCGTLTPYNVHDKCPVDHCDGKLIKIDPDKVLENNFYRNEYKNKKIEKIVIQEHTAQIERNMAKKFQNDFKNKLINILSCSTTFEMGIDIGDLETVFMRNVPPTPANYVQRAGRAGRRKDSSAYILTYCGTGSHDYTYFCDPQKMISGTIMPPLFNVLNKKIILRHLMAICLGYFFRDNPQYFKNVHELVFNDGYQEFNIYLRKKPKVIQEYIDRKVIPESIYSEYHNFKWLEKMDEEDKKMDQFVNSIKEQNKDFENAKDDAINEGRYRDADSIENQIKRIHDMKIIDALSKYCVIPKYGFPVDVVDLKLYVNGVIDNRYDLNRDLRIAISEYAPDSEVIVNKKKYTSKYITLPKVGELEKRYFCCCPTCKKINLTIDKKIANYCECGEDLSGERIESFIEPSLGFKTGITKESTRMKPKRSYSGEISYIGKGIKDDEEILIPNRLIIESFSNDHLLVLNKSNFYTCPVCGYSEKSTNNLTLTKSAKHKNYRQYDCSCDELNLTRIGHVFQTDVVKLEIPSLGINDKNGFAKALSFMYALLEGISIAMNIEREDIDGVVKWNYEFESYDILLFDNVPGGAGHVKRLMGKQKIIKSLQIALNKVSKSCCDEDTSCYNCLRNYYNQTYHSLLKRKYAIEVLNNLLNDLN